MSSKLALLAVGVSMVLSGCGKSIGEHVETLLCAGCSDDKKRDGGGSEDAKPVPGPSEGKGFALTLKIDNFESCDALQTAVSKQLLNYQANEMARQDYYEKLAQSRQSGGVGGSDGSDDAVSASAEPGAVPTGAASGANKSADADSAAPEASGAEAGEETFTNVQEGGVDEADCVFRTNPHTDFTPIRTPISIQSAQLFH